MNFFVYNIFLSEPWCLGALVALFFATKALRHKETPRNLTSP
jgi:hypothetical protein